MKTFLITEEEKYRILSMHKEATKRHYLGEQVTTGNTTSTGTTDSEETEVESEGVKIGTNYYKKKGLTNNNLNMFLYGKRAGLTNNQLVLSSLDELKKLGLTTKKESSRFRLDEIIRQWNTFLQSPKVGVLSPETSRVANNLTELMVDVMEYAGQENISAEQFNLTNYYRWVNSQPSAVPTEDKSLLELNNIYSNLDSVLKQVIIDNTKTAGL